MKIKTRQAFICFFSGLCFLFTSIRTEADTCTAGIVAGFYNGVWNTEQDAAVGLKALKDKLGARTATGETIEWKVFYNNTTSLWADLVETFNQRGQEAPGIIGDRWELFWEAVSGQGVNSGWTGTLYDSVSSLRDLLLSITNAIAAKTVAAITFTLENPPTISDSQKQKVLLDQYAREGKKFLLVAHSQGNVFVITSYDYIAPKVGGEAVKVIHIAPASGRRRGEYTLTNLDLVISVVLRSTGETLPFNTIIPSVFTRPSPVDASGHLLVKTYLNEMMEPFTKVAFDTQIALASLKEPTGTIANKFNSPFIAYITNNNSSSQGLPWLSTFDLKQCGANISGVLTMNRGVEYQKRTVSGTVSPLGVKLNILANVSDPSEYYLLNEICTGMRIDLVGTGPADVSGSWYSNASFNCIGGVINLAN